MIRPETAANGMLLTVADGTRAGLVLRRPTAASPYASSFRHPITNHQSQIQNPLHLLQSPKLDHFITDFPERCTNEVDRVIRGTGILPVIHGRDAHATRGSAGASNELVPFASPEPTGRVHINATQYFGDIPADVWSFRIGGYQVCEKWLKDRKGRTLDYADLQHYQKIVVALRETIRLMAAIDQTIASLGGWPEAFESKQIRRVQR